MSGTPNYLKAGDIIRSTRLREIVDYLVSRGRARKVLNSFIY